MILNPTVTILTETIKISSKSISTSKEVSVATKLNQLN